MRKRRHIMPVIPGRGANPEDRENPVGMFVAPLELPGLGFRQSQNDKSGAA